MKCEVSELSWFSRTKIYIPSSKQPRFSITNILTMRFPVTNIKNLKGTGHTVQGTKPQRLWLVSSLANNTGQKLLREDKFSMTYNLNCSNRTLCGWRPYTNIHSSWQIASRLLCICILRHWPSFSKALTTIFWESLSFSLSVIGPRGRRETACQAPGGFRASRVAWAG